MDLKILFKHDTSKNFKDFIPKKDELVFIVNQQRVVVGDGFSFVSDCQTPSDLAEIVVRGTPTMPKMYRMTGYNLQEYYDSRKMDSTKSRMNESSGEIENG